MEGRKGDNFEKGEKIEKPYLNNLVKENLIFSAHSLFKNFYTIIFLWTKNKLDVMQSEQINSGKTYCKE